MRQLPPRNLAPQPKVLRFGDVSIEWQYLTDYPIAINHYRLGSPKLLSTTCVVTFRRGEFAVDVDAGFEFDGASIPRIFWWIPGFAPIGPHLWAALLHDYLCDHPDKLPRTIADAVFAELIEETGIGWRGRIMIAAVWAYGLAKVLRRRRRVRKLKAESRESRAKQ